MSPIKPTNIRHHELIGLEVEVLYSPDPSQVRARGTVVDETAKLLLIRTRTSVKKIPKEYRVLKFHLPDEVEVEVDGSELLRRPEERVKRK